MKLSNVCIHVDGITQDEIMEDRAALTQLIIRNARRGDKIARQALDMMQIGSAMGYNAEVDEEVEEDEIKG